MKKKLLKSFKEEGIQKVIITSGESGKAAQIHYEDGFYFAPLSFNSNRAELPDVIEADELEDFFIQEEVSRVGKNTYKYLTIIYVGY